ncbi:MAG: glycogen debranching protein GlgX [Proteobacteria bacterium]|nr:glycogen debranching protein GlgX [Pseudomonadota bacterium]
MNHVTSPGHPTPLGATVSAEGINFAVYSQNAKQAFLDLFDTPEDTEPSDRITLDPKRNRTGDIWHIHVQGLKSGQLYGWRMDGPYKPLIGHRFNPHKLLLDPYAHAVIGGFDMFDDALYAFDRHSSLKDISYSYMDSARATAKAVAVQSAPMDWDYEMRPRYALSESVIYECHVKGMTAHPSSMSTKPGTFLGLIDKIPHLKSLGITSIELLPIAQFNELEPPTLIDPVTHTINRNYWGYATLGFFAPHQGYAFDRTPGAVVTEFRQMVRAFHEAQIEVILDVVFNHSGEGGEHGPSIAFKGFDNAVYYMLEKRGKYANYTGCGNTMNCNHPAMKHLIIECLRYWLVEMHVDGFRFDLATILGRSNKGEWINDPNLGLLSDIADDPVLRGCKLIAEAWDAGGLYKVGGFPKAWAEWNGKFRDDARRFWLGYDDTALPLARRIAGSKDAFADKPNAAQSINFITAHDGFTLRDLCSYLHKHNERNGEQNRDGMEDGTSTNFGVEGETDDPAIIRKRIQRAKNLIATLFVSRGTPMILGGDEIWRTQSGSNNGFCQDNEVSWVNWDKTPQAAEMLNFCSKMIALRNRFKALRYTMFADPKTCHPKTDNIRFHGIHIDKPDWNSYSHSFAFELYDGALGPRFYVAMNAWKEPLEFELPKRLWQVIADTSKAPPFDMIAPEVAPIHQPSKLTVMPDSVVILISFGCAK